MWAPKHIICIFTHLFSLIIVVAMETEVMEEVGNFREGWDIEVAFSKAYHN